MYESLYELDTTSMFYLFHLWTQFVDTKSSNLVLDIYYTIEGLPMDIHDEYGRVGFEEFLVLLREEIISKNNLKLIEEDDVTIISIGFIGFGIIHKESNCKPFYFKYRDFVKQINRRTVEINTREIIDVAPSGHFLP